jgi:hypothetical protein
MVSLINFDLTLPFSELSKYVSKPGKNHVVAAEIVLRYLQYSND